MDEDSCRPGGRPPRRVHWLRGHRGPAAVTATDVEVGGGGGGREQKTPPLKVLWQLRHNHVTGLRGLVILTKSFETSIFQNLLPNVQTKSFD